MEDSKCLECVVEKAQTPWEKQRPMLFIGAAVMFFISGTFLMGINLILAMVFGILGWSYWRKRHIEYEYTLMDGELNLDAVYNHKRRKKLLHGRLKNAVCFAPEDGESLNTYRNQNLKVKDFSSCDEGDEHWILVFKTEETFMGFRLTPDEAICKAIRHYLRMEGIRC